MNLEEHSQSYYSLVDLKFHLINVIVRHPPLDILRSGQVWGHTPEQRVAASTL